MHGAIDLGTSKVAVGLKAGERIFYAQRASQGIKQGRIISFDILEEPLLEAIYEVEKASRSTLEKVYLSLPTVCTRSTHLKTQIDIGGRSVQNAHIKSLLTPHIEASEELIHVFPKSYTLDKTEHIRDPLEMIGNQLIAHLHVITAPKDYLRNIHHLIGRCHLDIEAFVLGSYASSMSVLTEEELESGITVIDMGAGSTSICSFFAHQLVDSASISLGGQNITQDIACGLGVPFAQGERLKILHGSLHDSPVLELELTSPLPAIDLSQIIRARIEEILELIMTHMKYRFPIVLTGGAGQLSGLLQEINQGWRVRLGKPEEGAVFATLIGLLHYATQDYAGKQWYQAFSGKENFWRKILKKWSA